MIILRGLLFLLVAFGLYSSGRLAWDQWHTGEACPILGPVPACYIAFAGYLAMLAGMLFSSRFSKMQVVFYVGLALAGGLAILGSTLELIKGNVCPRVAGIPMCFISLTMSVLIGGLFLRITHAKPVAGEQA